MASLAPRFASQMSIAAFFVVVFLFGSVCDAFYLPETYMHTYPKGGDLVVKVNSLTSIETPLPFSYYSLPYCRPPHGIKKSAGNLGELLMGDQIETSPYIFHMNQNESFYLCTSKALNEHDVNILKQRIDDLYQVNVILDNLPAMRYTKHNGISIKWTGFPVGFVSEQNKEHYIINHLKFKVMVHEYEDAGFNSLIGTDDDGTMIPEEDNSEKKSGFEVVGFEVVPCSVKRDATALSENKMYDIIPSVQCDQEMQQMIKEQEQFSFTYEVSSVKSDIRWPSRWYAYLKMDGDRMHLFSNLNSLMLISFLAGIVFVILLRTVKRDLTNYGELEKEAQAQMKEELSGWKLVVGDVFRAPNHPKLLCVMVGDGVQISGIAAMTILFADFGFMSPASRGMLLTGMILLYFFLGIIVGYVDSCLLE